MFECFGFSVLAAVRSSSKSGRTAAIAGVIRAVVDTRASHRPVVTAIAMNPFRVIRVYTFALSLVIVLALVLGAMSSRAAASQPSLELRRVILSTGGVGYFEHEATVDGNVQLPLTVRFDQVDDVLKSLVIYDERGGVGTISLAGQEPLREVARELPFKLDALDSAAALLRALPGAEIKAGGPHPVEGRVLGVTAEESTSGAGVRSARHRVSVLTASNAVRQFILEEAEQIEFADPALRTQIAVALTGVARNRVQERRVLTITLKGSGRRLVRIGYPPGGCSTAGAEQPELPRCARQLSGFAIQYRRAGWRDTTRCFTSTRCQAGCRRAARDDLLAVLGWHSATGGIVIVQATAVCSCAAKNNMPGPTAPSWRS